MTITRNRIQSRTSFVMVLLTIPVLMNCVNLQTVNRYSSNSLEAARKFEDIPYSFAQHCLDRCEGLAIDSSKIYREIECHCQEYRRADSVTRQLYRAIVSYFDGLSKLSRNELTSFNLDPLAKAFRDQDIGPFQIRKEEADAYGKLTELLLRAFTDRYRKRKLNIYIEGGNESIQMLMTKLEYIEVQNLNGLLDFRKEILFDHYRSLLKSKLSDYERQRATEEYYDHLREAIVLQKKISTYGKSLRTISKGHQKLVSGMKKISGDELEQWLSPYTNEIAELISDFRKLSAR